MTNKKIAHPKRSTKRATENPVSAGIPQHPPGSPAAKAAEDYQAKRAVEMREGYLNALSALLTGGLWTDENEEGLRAEDVIIRQAAAQLKALLLSLYANTDDQGADGWVFADDEMTTADIASVLSGVVATLRNSREVLYGLRSRDELRSSVEQKAFARAEAAEVAS